MQRGQRHHYEILQQHTPCRLYFDIEFKYKFNQHLLQEDECDRLIEIFLARLARHLRLTFGPRIYLDRRLVLELDSSTPDKFSRHLICHIKRRPGKGRREDEQNKQSTPRSTEQDFSDVITGNLHARAEVGRHGQAARRRVSEGRDDEEQEQEQEQRQDQRQQKTQERNEERREREKQGEKVEAGGACRGGSWNDGNDTLAVGSHAVRERAESRSTRLGDSDASNESKQGSRGDGDGGKEKGSNARRDERNKNHATALSGHGQVERGTGLETGPGTKRGGERNTGGSQERAIACEEARKRHLAPVSTGNVDADVDVSEGASTGVDVDADADADASSLAARPFNPQLRGFKCAGICSSARQPDLRLAHEWKSAFDVLQCHARTSHTATATHAATYAATAA